ncbi:MAG: 2-phospho-L-lactate/phosphoenolpyruvate guanylyltransferase [Frankiaceae bacterium]|nr:2-phospho-L-lactate/phosphoenolpyruvate guanylyltransferase [Frankiaceae bacterium]
MTQWAVVVTVKRMPDAKTRLALPAPLRADVVLAMLRDTLAAAAAIDGTRLLVITDDDRAAAAASAHGAAVRGGEPAGGLNAAVTFGAATARALWGDVRVASLAGDLPALRPEELAKALDAATSHDRAFVADADDDGTTLLCARADLRPSYGPSSALRHERDGAVRLVGEWPGLRRDVDTLAGLEAVRRIRVGGHTAAALRGAVPYVLPMQATVKNFNAATGEGQVLLDNGRELPFPGSAFTRSGLRSLRPGQRVRLRTSGDAESLVIEAITIATLAFPDDPH